MPLPILNSYHPQPSAQDLVRFYHRCELHWCQQIAEDETLLDVGTALANPHATKVYDANQVMDAALPEGMSPADAVAQVDAHFASLKSRCWKWVMNPSQPAASVEPLVSHLLEKGFHRDVFDIRYLRGRPTGPIEEVSGLTLIPARASFKHVRQLEEESAAEWKTPELVETAMMHTEDPQSDSVLALKDGVAAGIVTVLTVGEMGQIASLFVASKFRRQGIGRTLMSRAMEICARSLFKHVFIGVSPDNVPAVGLYSKIGFEKVGDFVSYRAPS